MKSNPFSHPSRRDWFQQSFRVGATASLVSGCSWLSNLACAETNSKAKAKHIVFLWLNGGPSTIDLWDLKPGHENGGPFREIQTQTAGLRFSEHLPKIANWSNDIAVIRSLTSREGDHGRARQYVHTGYTPQPAIFFPLLGSLMAQEFADDEAEIPEFVSIVPEASLIATGSGFLGPRYAPLTIGRQGDEVSDLIVADLNPVEHITAPGRDARMMDPAAAETFQLSREPMSLREDYGMNVFGQGCLLARRLVERGVRFVEVSLDGWDTHSDNFERVKTLSQTLDQAFAALLKDLKERGLLDSTLIVCMGEFGRTPKINGNQGRDHWPGAWGAMLAGGGTRGGQAIGRTSEDGMEVVDRPVTIPDLIATTCSLVGIDPMKQNMSNVGRPIRIADPEAVPIAEVI